MGKGASTRQQELQIHMKGLDLAGKNRMDLTRETLLHLAPPDRWTEPSTHLDDGGCDDVVAATTLQHEKGDR